MLRKALTYHHVYILESESRPGTFYTGFTDLPVEERAACHNAGKVPHIAKGSPWRVETHIVFRNTGKVRALERYLKSGSDREFARRHF